MSLLESQPQQSHGFVVVERVVVVVGVVVGDVGDSAPCDEIAE
jgi:hypothetical protein